MDSIDKFVRYTANTRKDDLNWLVTRIFAAFEMYMNTTTNAINGVKIPIVNYSDKFDFYQFRDMREHAAAKNAPFTAEMRDAAAVTDRTLLDADLTYICGEMSARMRGCANVEIKLVFDRNVRFKYWKRLLRRSVEIPRYKFIMRITPRMAPETPPPTAGY